MADTRELILARIAALCVETAGFVSAVRNRALLKTDKRPAVILLDGDEFPVLTHGGRQNRARSGRMMMLTPSIMQLRPELYVLMPEDRPTNQDIGPALNQKRVDLCKAIAEDEQLIMLLGSNGNIIYNGCATDLKSGSALTGQMRLDFYYNYTFFPSTDNQGAS
jgi:hypothetical protein